MAMAQAKPSEISPSKTPVLEGKRNSPHQLLALTSIRFFAALLIVIKHGFECFGISKPIDPSNLGLWQGVTCFFVLSGFILTYVHPIINTRKEAFRFLVARFARIWPGYAASLLFLIAAVPQFLNTPHVLWKLFANFSLIQAWTFNRSCFSAFNTPTWSVSVELVFYLSFPFLIRSFSTTWRWKVALSLILSLLMVALVTARYYPDFPALGTSAPELININPLTRMFEFLCGMAAALSFMHSKRLKEISESQATTWQLLSVIAVIFSIALPSIWHLAPQLRSLEALRTWVIYCGIAPAYASLVLSLALEKGLLNKILTNNTLVYLGELSYSLFLFHYPAFLLFFQFKTIWEHYPIGLVAVAWGITCLLLSMASFEFIEKPCRKAIVRKLSPA
jgi:peptidoglycan/LPS O-acetylase OafA/YrhL